MNATADRITLRQIENLADRAENQKGEWYLRTIGYTIGRYASMDMACDMGIKFETTYDLPCVVVHRDDV